MTICVERRFLRGMNKLLAAFLALAGLAIPALGQEPDSLLPRVVIGTDAPVTLAGWLYHAGDDPAWAEPGHDDRSWPAVDSRLTRGELPPEGWSGIGWFRLHVTVDSAWRNRPLALEITQTGASEIYLDGKLIRCDGRVGSSRDEEDGFLIIEPLPTLFSFDSRPDHVMAVRYSSFLISRFHKLNHPPGFAITLDDACRAFTRKADGIRLYTAYHLFFTGLPLAFVILHLLLYLFYPRLKQNLYYAVLLGGLTAIPFINFRSHFINSPELYLFLRVIWRILLLLTALYGIRFVYSLLRQKPPRQFWFLLAGGVLLALFSWSVPVVYIYLFVLASLMEPLRAILVAVARRKDGAWILGIGSVCLIAFMTYQILMQINIIGTSEGFRFPYLFGVFIFIVSMSVYLARDFAKINVDLSRQLVQVRELSEKTIRQERQAKEQEMQRKLLEADVAHKARELEKAEELKKAHADLAKAHMELVEKESQLVQSEKMAALGQLVAGVAHEINTPMGAIRSLHNTLVLAMDKLKGELARLRPADPESDARVQRNFKIIQEANRVIESGTERVSNIVRRLRSFARLDEAELKTVDIRRGLEDTLALIHHEIGPNVKVIRDYGDVPPVACFPGKLNQVFLNILINAVQAIEGQGEITITTYAREGYLHITFKDTGVGIPEENFNKIFDPGFTTKGVGVGTGLGLPICYQIMQEHRGTIEVESEVGKGTTFTLILPMNLEQLIEAEKRKG